MISFRDYMRQSAREYLARVLTVCDNNVARAAHTAKLSRAHFYKLLAQHGLNRKPPKSGRWEEFGL